jgi:hypothetical protein
MFTRVFSEATRLEEVFEAWVSAARDARVAWESWSASATPDRADAYAAYCASLDREEHAAAVLAAAVGSRDRGVRTDNLRFAA